MILYRIPRWLVALFFCASVMLFVFSAQASTVIQRSVEEMSVRADVVVRGTITTRQSMRYNGQIITRLELDVDEQLAGETVPQTIQIWLPGGELDGLRAHVSGVANYQEGDDIIAFLEHGPEGSWRALALSWSTYHCSGETAYRSARGMSGIVPGVNPLLSTARALQNAHDDALPVSDLTSRIRRAGATP